MQVSEQLSPQQIEDIAIDLALGVVRDNMFKHAMTGHAYRSTSYSEHSTTFWPSFTPRTISVKSDSHNIRAS